MLVIMPAPPARGLWVAAVALVPPHPAARPKMHAAAVAAATVAKIVFLTGSSFVP